MLGLTFNDGNAGFGPARTNQYLVAAYVRRRILELKTLSPRYPGGYGSRDDSCTDPSEEQTVTR